MKKVVIYVLFLCFSLCCCVFPMRTFGMTVEAPLYWCKSEESYNQLLETEPMPPDFIPYQNVSFLGKFKELRYNSTDDFVYTLTPQEPEHKDITFKVSTGIHLVNRVEAPENHNLERNVYADKPGRSYYCQVNDFYYLYVYDQEIGQSRLFMIAWCNKDQTKWCSVDYHYHDTINESCFLQELVSPETATAARERLWETTKCALETADATPAEPTPFPWVWIAVPAAAVLVCGALAAAVVLIRRKKKSKS